MSKELYLFFAGLIVLNIVTFVMFYIDKQHRRHHIHHPQAFPRHVFMTLAILGGSLGELLGMLLLHHKWHHKEYVIFLPIIFIIQVIGLIIFLMGYFSDVVSTEGLVPA